MSNELAIQGASSTLAIAETQTAFTSQQVALLQHIGVEDASEADLQVFFHQCKRTGLDPFAKQIYMIGRVQSKNVNGQWLKETKQTIQTGIDGYRLIGRRAAAATRETISLKPPQWAHPDGGWRDVWAPAWGQPVAARVTILRNGEEFTGVALFDEYKQTKRDGGLTQMWAQRPAGQIAKCAESLAWRMAFPQDLAGIYTEEEMGQADNAYQPAPANSAPSAMDKLRAATQPEPEPAPDLQDLGETPTIPDTIATAAAKAKADGNLPEYFEWLAEQGAPAHILNYVTEQMEN